MGDIQKINILELTTSPCEYGQKSTENATRHIEKHFMIKANILRKIRSKFGIFIAQILVILSRICLCFL